MIKSILFLSLLTILASCDHDVSIYITVLDANTRNPVDSANVIISRTDRTHKNFGGFNAVTDTSGQVNFILTSGELKDYRHSIIVYKEGMFQTEQSNFDITETPTVLEVELLLSSTETQYHKDLQGYSPSADSLEIK